MPTSPRHSLGAGGIALIGAGNATASYSVLEQLFGGIRRGLEAPGEGPLKRFNLDPLTATLAHETHQGRASDDGALVTKLQRADAIVAIAGNRDHAGRGRVRTTAERLLNQAAEDFLESVRVEAERRPGHGRELAQTLSAELDAEVSSFVTRSGGSDLANLERRVSRSRQLLSLRAELSNDFLERAPQALAVALTPYLDDAEISAARGALAEQIHAVHSRLVSELELIAGKCGGFQVKLDRIAANLSGRLETAKAAEAPVRTGSFELILPGITAEELLARLADAMAVQARKLPEAVAERLADALREMVASRRAAGEARRLTLAQVIGQAEEDEVINALLAIILHATGEQPVFSAVQNMDGGAAAAAQFLWETAEPTALPSPVAIPRTGVHVHRVNILTLPTTEGHMHVREALIAEAQRLAGGEGVQVVEAAPDDNSITLQRITCGFPPSAIPWIGVLSEACGKASGRGHHSRLIAPPKIDGPSGSRAPAKKTGWLILPCGGTGGGAAETTRTRLAAQGIPHVVREIDLDKSAGPDILLPLARYLPAIKRAPGRFGKAAEYLIEEQPFLLDPDFIEDGGAGTIPCITELAVSCNKDLLQAELRDALKALARQGADSVKIVVVASSGGGTGSALARLMPMLLHERSFRDGVELGLTPGAIRSVVLFLLDPIGKIDLATPKDDAEALQPLRIKSNSYDTWVDFANLSESGTIQYGFITGFSNSAGVSLDNPKDAERYLGNQVAAFVSTFGAFHSHLMNNWVFINQGWLLEGEDKQ